VAHVFHLNKKTSDVSNFASVFAEAEILKIGVSVQSDSKLVKAFFEHFYKDPVIRGLSDLEPNSRTLSFYHDLINTGALKNWNARCDISQPPLGLKVIFIEYFLIKCRLF
jgi:hypothetical protein